MMTRTLFCGGGFFQNLDEGRAGIGAVNGHFDALDLRHLRWRPKAIRRAPETNRKGGGAGNRVFGSFQKFVPWAGAVGQTHDCRWVSEGRFAAISGGVCLTTAQSREGRAFPAPGRAGPNQFQNPHGLLVKLGLDISLVLDSDRGAFFSRADAFSHHVRNGGGIFLRPNSAVKSESRVILMTRAIPLAFQGLPEKGPRRSSRKEKVNLVAALSRCRKHGRQGLGNRTQSPLGKVNSHFQVLELIELGEFEGDRGSQRGKNLLLENLFPYWQSLSRLWRLDGRDLLRGPPARPERSRAPPSVSRRTRRCSREWSDRTSKRCFRAAVTVLFC